MLAGSVADWAMVVVTLGAVVVAGIALGFSRKANEASSEANRIAQAVYAEDVRARNEAQARLVYASVLGGAIYRKGDPISRRDGEYSMTQVGGNVLGSDPDRPHEYIALEDMQIIDIEIINGSTEVIGAFQTQLYDLRKQAIVPGSIGSEFIRPGEKTTRICIATPEIESHFLPEISFRDSAGLFWSRRGYEPVHPLDPERRKIFDDLARLRGGVS
ncbi:hypothetical protein QBL02_06295 [Leucobacter sp. UT-8R-CII-1-4]|uniref:hypothetical protein n=1 Tax=Leucobacter sp. UT-8R-CII-1-4 TaxID=3040075 RepID=UPI0024A9511E|nr:hypothetical protein [Leucobacter sp. UT-8R-CII-1-4]MDI6023152.1 hypothetical protein [Leucobacter sp. UT-8R-CII-1-4]